MQSEADRFIPILKEVFIMFGISGEHLLLVLIVLILFGPKKLPDLGHSIGRTMKNFKDALNGNEAERTSNKKEQIVHSINTQNVKEADSHQVKQEKV